MKRVKFVISTQMSKIKIKSFKKKSTRWCDNVFNVSKTNVFREKNENIVNDVLIIEMTISKSMFFFDYKY